MCPTSCRGPGRRRIGEQADADVLGLENLLAVAFDPAVGDAEIQLAADDAFEVEMELQQLGGRQHLAHELHLADRQRPAGARPAEPAESEAEQLPQRVHPEATDRKSTRLNSSHYCAHRMPSSA